MDPNSPNQNFPTQPQADAVQPLDNQTQVSPSPLPVDQNQVVSNPTSNIQTAAANTVPVQTVNQPVQEAVATEDNYVNEVGEDLIDLLDEISENDTLLQAVANEMKIDTNKVASMLSNLLDKIDGEQITSEDIALIMAATVADEVPEKK